MSCDGRCDITLAGSTSSSGGGGYGGHNHHKSNRPPNPATNVDAFGADEAEEDMDVNEGYVAETE